MFDCVIDLMINLGYQMVEDCPCYSFSVCWAMQVGMSVFQKWRKARMKQMRLARSSELVQSLAGSTWVKYTWFFVWGWSSWVHPHVTHFC